MSSIALMLRLHVLVVWIVCVLQLYSNQAHANLLPYQQDQQQRGNQTHRHKATAVRGRWQVPRYSISSLLAFVQQHNVSARYYFPVAEYHHGQESTQHNKPKVITDIDRIRSLWHEKSADFSIPRIIHQLWKTLNIATHSEHAEAAAMSIATHASEFLHILWTDVDIALFVKEQSLQHQKLYNSLTMKIKKMDVARYLILNTYGGVYLDLDMLLLAPLSPLLRVNHNLTNPYDLAFVTYISGEYKKGSYAGNAFFASKPQSPILAHLLQAIERHPCFNCTQGTDVLAHTGPLALGQEVRHTLLRLKTSREKTAEAVPQENRRLQSRTVVTATTTSSVPLRTHTSQKHMKSRAPSPPSDTQHDVQDSPAMKQQQPDTSPTQTSPKPVEVQDLSMMELHDWQAVEGIEVVRIFRHAVVGNTKDKPSAIVHYRSHQW